MKTSDFYYELPEELIAQDPLADRSASRLLAVNRAAGEFHEERFRDIVSHFHQGDVLVINDTKVIPARLIGKKADTGAKIEVLLLKRLSEREWETLVKPGRKCMPGTYVEFGIPDEDGIYPLTAEIREVLEEGLRRVRFIYEGIFEEILDKLGEMPLPPYIHHPLSERDRYNTVYARNNGSAAAPTAGLHFTEELLDEIRGMGVKIAPITLHVGLGTFRPVKAEDISDHHMHSEFYRISPEAAETVNFAKRGGHRVICVGTTSVRTMETAADENGMISPGSGWTDIFLYPGCTFKVTDAIITNFHLPESTLLMLVSAFAGRELILRAYEEAVKKKFRFYSFGDAMLIE